MSNFRLLCASYVGSLIIFNVADALGISSMGSIACLIAATLATPAGVALWGDRK